MAIIDHFAFILFGILFPFATLYATYLLRLSWRLRGAASLTWPRTKGTILESRIELDSDQDPRFKTRYEYVVDSETFIGDVVTYNGINVDQKTADAVLVKYPAGSTVPVYFDPAEPSVAVLEQGFDTSHLIPAVFVLVLLLCIGVSMLVIEALALMG